MTRTPIFLLSLPRSGSTLVQRVLGAHPDVETVPEPWLLLPHLYALRDQGIVAEYRHRAAARAIREFVSRLPEGQADYDEAIRQFALTLYDKAASGPGRYFVDNTPRYHYVVQELFRTFPDARYVFLWRNPLAIVASIVETWCRGRWNVGRWEGDLHGAATLVDAFQAHRDDTIMLRYEDLVTGGDDAWKPLFAHLGLEFDSDLLVSFAETRLEGEMGDPTGQYRYRSIVSDPVDKWRSILGSPVRKAWCRSYLDRLGEQRLATMGYDLGELTSALGELPSRPWSIPSDVVRGGYWSFAQWRKRLAFKWMAPRTPR
jgi:Sulfotransferase family